MTNNGQEPAHRPDTERDSQAGDTNSWIIVDDLANTAATGGASDGAAGNAWSGSWSAASEPPTAATETGGWDDFAPGETWNGMPVTPPGSSPASAPPEAPTKAPQASTVAPPPGMEDHPSGATMRGGSRPSAAPHAGPGSGWDDPTSSAGGASDTEIAWFLGEAPEDDGLQDRIGDYAAHDPAAPHRGVAHRAPVGWTAPSLGGASVTLLVACLGFLLVVASAIWHPRVP